MFSRLFIGILLLILPSAAYGSVGSLDSTGLWGGSFSPSSGIEALPAGAVSKDSLEARGYKEPLPTWKDIEFSFGLKLGGGGDLLLPPSGSSYTEPGNDYSFSMPIFDGIRGGYNYTVGFFGDLRLFRYLGVESGIVLTRHTLKETTNWTYSETKPDNSVVTLKSRSEETMTWGTIRIPVMFRFIAPVGDNHIWFGAGPEFSFGQWARGDMNISTTGAPLQGERSKLQATHDSGVSPLQGVTTNETWLTVGFGYMVQAARNMKIPIDFRFGWNPDQPDDYFERMSFCPENLPCGTLPTSATDEDRYVSRVIMRAQTSMYAEILVGLLYNLY